MKATNLLDGRTYLLRLTTESSSSHYGIPVLVGDDGQAYGTGDLVGVELEPETPRGARLAG